jgi:mannose-1-phosphate guanylyltransferase
MKINSDIKNRFVIIMAGGRGERFWPLSREKIPKQLLPLLGKRSFLQQAVDRVLPLVPAKNIFIITNEAQLPEVRKQLPKILKANLIASSSDAVVVGSAVVNQIASHGRFCDLVPQVSRFVRLLKSVMLVKQLQVLKCLKGHGIT